MSSVKMAAILFRERWVKVCVLIILITNKYCKLEKLHCLRELKLMHDQKGSDNEKWKYSAVPL